MQQLREAFAEAGPYRYAILDHDSMFDDHIDAVLEATGLKGKRTSINAISQNGTAERWIGSYRREILDHIIPAGEEQGPSGSDGTSANERSLFDRSHRRAYFPTGPRVPGGRGS